MFCGSGKGSVMEIIEEIRKHPLYAENYKKLQQAEKERKFCRHQMEHFLAVARIAYIFNLERNLGIRKEVIYAAAILHDIGKYRQYTQGIPHERASAGIAEIILNELPGQAFSGDEKQAILQAVSGHRKKREHMEVLEELLYTADKCSRSCFACESEPECSWGEEKKNRQIRI